MRLYSYWRSGSAWRVRIALAYKSVPFELIPVHLVRDGGEQHGDAFRGKNLMEQVPVLEVDPEGAGEVVRLTQSMAIIEYLDERFPEPPLLPADRLARAHARRCAELVNSGIQPLQNLAFQQALRAVGVDPVPLVRGFISRGLTALEAEVNSAGKQGGLFMVGDTPTLADVYLIPQLYAARRMSVDLQPFPTLLRIERACEGLPAFQVAHPDVQPDREPPQPAT